MKELSPFELFQTYKKGWRCGTGSGPLDPRFTEHKDQRFVDLYMEGYRDGVKARMKLDAKLMKRFGYKPSILRIQ
jgi:hypothetical protein